MACGDDGLRRTGDSRGDPNRRITCSRRHGWRLVGGGGAAWLAIRQETTRDRREEHRAGIGVVDDSPVPRDRARAPRSAHVRGLRHRERADCDIRRRIVMGPHVVRMPDTAPATAGAPRLGSHARSVIGGKAAALAALARAGEAIPAWFAISATDSDPGPELCDSVVAALREICPDGRAVAVRSSAVDEDGNAHSFAGQLESFLNVPHADVIENVMRVRASGRSERIESYRRSSGLNGPARAPGVLIQRMVNAQWAGVAFSADPVTGDRSRAVVAAVKGLGDGLVSGERDADTFGLDSNGSIVSRQDASEPSDIPLELVSRVAALARRISEHFGTPQDIEWAFEGETIFLLQARPITTLRAPAGADG